MIENPQTLYDWRKKRDDLDRQIFSYFYRPISVILILIAMIIALVLPYDPYLKGLVLIAVPVLGGLMSWYFYHGVQLFVEHRIAVQYCQYYAQISGPQPGRTTVMVADENFGHVL